MNYLNVGQIKEASERNTPIVLVTKNRVTGEKQSEKGIVTYRPQPLLPVFVLDFGAIKTTNTYRFFSDVRSDADIWRYETDAASYTFSSCQSVPIRAKELLYEMMDSRCDKVPNSNPDYKDQIVITVYEGQQKTGDALRDDIFRHMFR